MKKHFTRMVCLALTLCMVAAYAPAYADEEEPEFPKEYPVLAIARTAYEDATAAGTVRARITLAFHEGSGDYTAQRAENVVVKVECLNGLHADRDAVYLGTISDEESFDLFLSYADPEKKDDEDGMPKLKLHIGSENCGKTEYTAVIDTMPQARVVTVRQASEGGLFTPSLPQDQLDAEEIFHNGFADMYDGKKVRRPAMREIGEGGYSYKDIIDWIAEDHEDENDIAFICFITHGLIDRNYAPTDQLDLFDREQEDVTYWDVLSYINKKVKGRAVIVFDSCFSGHAIEAAQRIGLDEERFAVITATEPDMEEPASGTLSQYGETTALSALFNKLQREGRSMGKKAQTVYDFEGLAIRWDEILLQTMSNIVAHGEPTRLLIAIFWLLEDSAETAVKADPTGIDVWNDLKDKFSQIADGVKAFFGDLKTASRILMRPTVIDLDDQETLADMIGAYYMEDGRNRRDKLISIINILMKYMPSQFLRSAANILYSQDVPIEEMSQLNRNAEQALAGSIGITHPQYYGNMQLPLFVYSAEYDDAYRLPTVVREEQPVYTPPARMEITVLDAETEKPLAGAAVTLWTDESLPYSRTVYTDKNGVCRLCGSARVYELKAEMDDYENKETKINFAARLGRARILMDPQKETLKKYADYLNRVCVPNQKLAALGAFNAGEKPDYSIADDFKMFSGRQWSVTGLLSAVFLKADGEEEPVMLTVSAEYRENTGTIAFPLSLYGIRDGKVTLLSTDDSFRFVTYIAGETQRMYITVHRDAEGGIMIGQLLDYTSTWAGEFGQTRNLFEVKNGELVRLTWEDERLRAFSRCPIQSGDARIDESKFITDMRTSGNVLCQVNYTSYLEHKYANEDSTCLRAILSGEQQAAVLDPGPLAEPINRLR